MQTTQPPRGPETPSQPGQGAIQPEVLGPAPAEPRGVPGSAGSALAPVGGAAGPGNALGQLLPARADLSPQEQAEIRAIFAAGKAPNTVRGYRSDFADFAAWCRKHHVMALPATSEAVVQYLASLLHRVNQKGEPLKAVTFARRVAAIRHAHKLREYPTPTDSGAVKEFIAGFKNSEETRSEGKEPIDRDLLRKMLAMQPMTLRGFRDRALLLVGWFGAFRRSEFTKIKVEDITWGSNYMVIALGTTKTSRRKRKREEVALKAYPEDPNECPVAALRNWLDIAHITSGYVFHGFALNSESELRLGKIHETTVNRLVKSAVKACGLNPDDYGCHSLRAGFVTQGIRDKHDIPAIQRVTRQSPAVLLGYAREADPLRGSAADQMHGEKKP